MKPIAKGSLFPHLIFKERISKQTQNYLGVPKNRFFSFGEINASLTVIELFNTYCVSCPKNVPVLNKTYLYINNDPELKGKVKIFGIAAGNNKNEVEHYRGGHGVLYPILADPDFSIHDALGSPRVPYTLFIKKNVKGKDIVGDTHMGFFDSPDDCMGIIKRLLQ